MNERLWKEEKKAVRRRRQRRQQQRQQEVKGPKAQMLTWMDQLFWAEDEVGRRRRLSWAGLSEE